ncbi:MAG: glucosamine-6-phosphate deaminase [Chloroflexota bacterium]
MTTRPDPNPSPSTVAQADNLRAEVYPTRLEMGLAAAAAVAQTMRVLLARPNAVRMVFASAPSQNEFLAELGAQPGIDWERVVAFHLDEYVGLGASNPRSFAGFLREALFNRVPIGAFHRLDGLATDPARECARYTALVNESPIDILCCGIGENGHLAFNDPPVADFADPLTVKVVELTHGSRVQQVHDGTFPTLDAVPRQALTLTIPALMGARSVHCIVPGPSKAAAVRDTLLGPLGPACPATAMRSHPAATLYLDREAAALWQAARG